MTDSDRRLLMKYAAATFAVGAVDHVLAAPEPNERQAPGIYRYRLGAFELTAIHDGIWHRPVPNDFVRNADFAAVRRAMDRVFMPDGHRLPLPFTALLVNTGRKLVLIDTGSGGQIAPTAGMLAANLRAADIHPSRIDIILISHFHPDHINGIKTKDNELVFANAAIKVPARDWAYWMDDANLRAAPDGRKTQFLNARRIFRDLANEVVRFEPEAEVAPGITAIAAFGHTPGHTAFAVSSGDRSMLILGDTTSHPALFLRHPHWQGSFDVDGAMAARTRVRLLDRVAADRMLVAGYHFPFPACGHVVKERQTYRLVPIEWQSAL